MTSFNGFLTIILPRSIVFMEILCLSGKLHMNPYRPSRLTPALWSGALFRFYWSTAVRLVQRVFLPFFASFVVIYAFMGHDFFQTFTAALIGGGYFASAVPSTLFTLVFAGMAGRRVSGGITGWIRHLPVSTNVFRNTAVSAIFVSILPVLGVPALLAVSAAWKYDVGLVPYLPGLVLAGLAAALHALPMKRGLATRLCLVLACLGYTSQNWILFLSGCTLHLVGTYVSGPLTTKNRPTGFAAGRLFDFLVISRALRLRLLYPYFFSVIVFPILFLVLANNSLDDRQAGMVIRLACGFSLALFCAVFTQILTNRRPPWLWQRSLPKSSGHRLFQDGLTLLIFLLPLVIAFAVVRFRILAFILGCLPALVVVSVMNGRRIPSGRFGVFGRIYGQAILPVLLFGLSPWVSLFYLAMTPWLIKKTAFEEKALAVSQWQEVLHFGEGDSQSWRGS
jgi:hypothetical protein